MPGKNIYLSLDDFEEQRVLEPSGLECTINNLVFRKGDTVEHSRIKEILDKCKKYNGFNINTLVIKSKSYLTIWIEEKSKEKKKQVANSPVESPANTPIVPQFNHAGLPLKTITKKYRGQVYEETVVDWAAVGQQPSNKPRRKYRGQYID